EASGCWRRPTPTRREEAHHGYPPLALLSAEVIEKRGGFFVSPEIWAQLAPATVPAVLSSGLLYVPPHPAAARLRASCVSGIRWLLVWAWNLSRSEKGRASGEECAGNRRSGAIVALTLSGASCAKPGSGCLPI